MRIRYVVCQDKVNGDSKLVIKQSLEELNQWMKVKKLILLLHPFNNYLECESVAHVSSKLQPKDQKLACLGQIICLSCKLRIKLNALVMLFKKTISLSKMIKRIKTEHKRNISLLVWIKTEHKRNISLLVSKSEQSMREIIIKKRLPINYVIYLTLWLSNIRLCVFCLEEGLRV